MFTIGFPFLWSLVSPFPFDHQHLKSGALLFTIPTMLKSAITDCRCALALTTREFKSGFEVASTHRTIFLANVKSKIWNFHLTEGLPRASPFFFAMCTRLLSASLCF
ncbi:hypothetical protein DFH05DRAFT_588397 [Lentinula detonsa]|uniref:Uncharacterized protein n=1 Tax=Lentinula detonsa TaxID=2804962 RepID=A0A9W8P7Z9_9AGAR|nr:hypothetical protein DFH05DRAFT_588397 [Lentinula detonsa]